MARRQSSGGPDPSGGEEIEDVLHNGLVKVQTKSLGVPAIVILFVVVLGIGIASIASANSGQFIYTLDDPYIHLALARNIANGHYGINAGESSSPSSSLVWPLILAPFASFPWADFVPLAVCLASAALLAIIAGRELPWWALTGFLVLTNAVGLALTGMEHSLQVLLSVVAAYGLIRFVRSQETPLWWLASLAIQPSVRYENLIVTVCCCVFLMRNSKSREGWITLGVAILPLLLFSVFLKGLGLSALPSSILAKDAAGTGNPALTIAKNGFKNLRDTPIEAVIMIFVTAWVFLAARQRSGPIRTAGLTIVVAGTLHLLLGRFGWMSRYEPYMLGFLLLGASMFWAHVDGRWRAVLVVGLTYPVAYYAMQTSRVTYFSHRIYVQQDQMARFVRDYWQKPVAVNDLGLVGWNGGQYVLDLWGLASQNARLARSRKEQGWMGRIVDAHDVRLVMIYDHWLPDRPASWIKVASLTRDESVQNLDNSVSIYATDTESAREASTKLKRFAPTLPADAHLVFGLR